MALELDGIYSRREGSAGLIASALSLSRGAVSSGLVPRLWFPRVEVRGAELI